MRQSTFGIIGSGWRAEYFARCARALPDLFTLCGFATTNKAKGEQYRAEFGAPVFASFEEMLRQRQPDFVVLCIAAVAAPGVLQKLANRGVPVLLETPAAPDMKTLLQLHQTLPPNAKIQVAEQYFLRPMQQAHLQILSTQKLGRPVEARVSLTNDYHALSLLRKYLGIGFENAMIHAHQFTVRGYSGYEREGVPEVLVLKDRPHTLAILEFSQGVALYDFEEMQHRSFIRSQQIQIKGEQGEINNALIRYLVDQHIPMEAEMIRKNLGEDENVEGFGLKGIMADGQWVYRSPFPDSRLSDDEIAVAQTMAGMVRYVDEGVSFYSFAQASQDLYLALLVRQATQEGRPLRCETQPWAMG